MVIAIMGILFAIALPVYSNYTYKVRKNDVQAVLLQNAQIMERYYTANNKYSCDADTVGLIKEAPVDGSSKYYSIDFDMDGTTASCSDEAYRLIAKPKNQQKRYADNTDFLTLDSAGRRKWDADHDGTMEDGETSW